MENKISENKWKKKALEYSSQNRRLKKRIAELEVSRNNWKTRFISLRQQRRRLISEKPSRHHYPVVLIWLCLRVYNCCHCSYRNCCEMVVAGSIVLNIADRKPSASTIRNWVIKYGYHHYCHSEPASGKWVVIVDESVSIGQEKLLLVLGVSLDNHQFTHTLKHKDVRVLHISIATSWKAEAICEILSNLRERLEISYCISDKGNNIMGALKQAGCYHVYDCSHQWARLMEKLYSKSEDFVALMASVSMLRKRWVLSKQSHLIPPSVRNKSRFQNIFPIVKWAEKIWLHWERLEQPVKDQLLFLQQSKALIEELIVLQQVVTQMSQLLKVNGLNTATMQQCNQILTLCKEGRPLEFKNKLTQAWLLHKERLDKNETLLCCSDIIESYFGRFKNKIKSNGMQAITETVLTMSGWATEVTKLNTQTALEKVHIKDIEQWKKHNTTPSLIKKRNMFFKKKCTQKPIDF